MRLGRARSVGLVGLEATLVDVEVSVGGGAAAHRHRRAARRRAARGARPVPGGGREQRASAGPSTWSPSTCRRPRCRRPAPTSTSPSSRRCSPPTAPSSRRLLGDAVLLGEVGPGRRRPAGAGRPAGRAGGGARAGFGTRSCRPPRCARRGSSRASRVHGVGTLAELVAVLRGERASPSRNGRAGPPSPRRERGARPGRRRGPAGGAVGPRGGGRGRPPPVPVRAARGRQDTAGRAAAGDPARPADGGGAGGRGDPVAGRAPRHRGTAPASAVRGAAPLGVGGRRWSAAGRDRAAGGDLAGPPRRPVPRRGARVQSRARWRRCGRRWSRAGSSWPGRVGRPATRPGSSWCWRPTPARAGNAGRRGGPAPARRWPSGATRAAVRADPRPDRHRADPAADDPGLPARGRRRAASRARAVAARVAEARAAGCTGWRALGLVDERRGARAGAAPRAAPCPTGWTCSTRRWPAAS